MKTFGDIVSGAHPAGAYRIRIEDIKLDTTDKPFLQFETKIVDGERQGKGVNFRRYLTEGALWKLGNDLIAIGFINRDTPLPTSPQGYLDHVRPLLGRVVDVDLETKENKTSGKTFNEVNFTSMSGSAAQNGAVKSFESV